MSPASNAPPGAPQAAAGGRERAAEGELALDPDANLAHLVHHTELPHTAISLLTDRLLRRIGDTASWVWLLLLGVIVFNVTMRYAFGEGRIELEELQWHLYSIGFLVGLSYVLAADEHVRIDVLHERMSLRAQCWIELYGILLLLLPFLLLVLVYALPFALIAVAALSRLTRVSALLFGAPAPVVTSEPPFASAAGPGDRAGDAGAKHAGE